MFCFRFVCSCALLIAGSATLPIAPLCAQESNSTATDAILLPKEGEIRLTGTLQSVDWKARRIEMLASTFTLPNGKNSAIEPAKPKIIILPLEVSPFVRDDILRGDLTRALKAAELKAPLSMIVIGRDSGSGQPLAARVVAVWDSVENGRFVLQARLKTATEIPPTAPQPVAPEPVVPQPVVPEPVAPHPPVAPPKAVTPRVARLNQVLDSDFELGGADPGAGDWDFGNPKKTQWKEDPQSSYVSLNTQGDQRKIARPVALDPTWKTLKLTARVRAQGLKSGVEIWQIAHVGFAFHDAQNKILGYGSPINLTKDSDWRIMSGVAPIPEGATRAVLDAANFGAGGVLDVDDIIVQHDVAPDAPAITPGFPEGGFETLDDDGELPGWKLTDPRLSIAQENDNHFLHLSNPTNEYLGVDSPWQLEPNTKRVRLSARIRVRDLKVGPGPYDNARIGVVFLDASGERAGDWPPALEMRQNSDWQTLSQTLVVPTGALFIKLTPQLLNSSGVLDIDDVKIEAIK